MGNMMNNRGMNNKPLKNFDVNLQARKSPANKVDEFLKECGDSAAFLVGRDLTLEPTAVQMSKLVAMVRAYSKMYNHDEDNEMLERIIDGKA